MDTVAVCAAVGSTRHLVYASTSVENKEVAAYVAPVYCCLLLGDVTLCPVSQLYLQGSFRQEVYVFPELLRQQPLYR
jgi:hypothetical protein